MADVLLIFVREDLASATALAEQCEKAGYSIFSGSPLETRGEDYSAAIIIWSESAEPSLIFTESAARAIASGKALVASFAAEAPPEALADAPAFDLYDWDGETDDAEFVSLFEALKRSVLGAEPAPTEAVAPEAIETLAIAPAFEASVLPELDQPEPDHPETDLPDLEPPDLEEPELEEPKPPQAALVEPKPIRPEPPKLALVELEPADVTASEPAPELRSESEPASPVVDETQPVLALADGENFSPPLSEAPPGERRMRGKKPQRARRAHIARPAAGTRAQPTRDVWRDVAQAALLSAVVFVAVMQIGHWALGPTPLSMAANAPIEQPSAQMASLHTPIAAEIAAPAADSPAPPAEPAAAASASVAPSPNPARRASSRTPRSGFIQASYSPDSSLEAAPEAPVVEEPEPPRRQRADMRRFRHGSKG